MWLNLKQINIPHVQRNRKTKKSRNQSFLFRFLNLLSIEKHLWLNKQWLVCSNSYGGWFKKNLNGFQGKVLAAHLFQVLVQPSGKPHLFVHSGYLDHQCIGMGCCGNNIVISNHVAMLSNTMFSASNYHQMWFVLHLSHNNKTQRILNFKNSRPTNIRWLNHFRHVHCKYNLVYSSFSYNTEFFISF